VIDVLIKCRIGAKGIFLTHTPNVTETKKPPGSGGLFRMTFEFEDRVLDADQVPNSTRRSESWPLSRSMIELCIWLTRDSERSSVAPISFIVSSS